MKKALKHAIRLLREEEEKADRKTENSSEKPNNCEPQTDCDGCKHSNAEKESDECYDCSRYYTDNYQPQTEEWHTWQDEQEYNARHGKE